MPTNRLEAFSDGVIAVAITLLVLSIGIPSPDVPRSFWGQIGHMWPQFAAYAVSFLTVGIIWINHHAMLSRLRETDHSILVLNLILLMTIVILPFATSTIAAYLQRSGPDRSGAAALYAGAFLLMAIAFSLLNHHVLMRRAHLLDVALTLEQRRRILQRAVSGVFPYAVATGVAFVSPYTSLAICAALAIFYALPVASGGSIGRG